MFLSNLPRLGNAFLLTTIVAMVESQHGPMDQGYGSGMEECCREKMVGSVSYTLLDDPFRGQIPHQCLNDCVYTVSGTSRPKFCFERGSVSFHLMLENCIFAVFCYYWYQLTLLLNHILSMLFIGDLPTQCLSGRILIFMIYKLKLSAKISFLKGFQLSFKFFSFFLDYVTLS